MTTERPASPAVDGQLVVTTEPEGARVTVDGVGEGHHARVRFRICCLGEKHVRVTKDGFQSATRLVPLGSDRPSRTIPASSCARTDSRASSLALPVRPSSACLIVMLELMVWALLQVCESRRCPAPAPKASPSATS